MKSTLKLHHQLSELYRVFKHCQLCGHRCKVDRTRGQFGNCKSSSEVYISSYNLHFGEEPPISGSNGSGTIFFTRCNLNCVFCQNYPISQFGHGNPVSIQKIVSIMIELQNRGAHNINFVSPTHFTPMIVEAILKAKENGLKIPTVFNCGGYETPEMLKLLDGFIDIYMPDAKYSDKSVAIKYSNAPDYPSINKSAIKEMHRQVGDLKLDSSGIAIRGLLVRHLILPGNISDSKCVLKFIAEEISPNTYISIMSQYHPAHMSDKFSELSRHLTKKEYSEVIEFAEKIGLRNAFIQWLD